VDSREKDVMTRRNAKPSLPMVIVQIDVLAGSPCIPTNNGRIAFEKDFEKAFVTLPALMEQEARRYAAEIDARCSISVQPPIDVLTQRSRYFIRVEHPQDVAFSPEELKQRLEALVRSSWAPPSDRPSEPALVGGVHSVGAVPSVPGTIESVSGGSASSAGTCEVVSQPSPGAVKPDAVHGPSALSAFGAGSASLDPPASKGVLPPDGSREASASGGAKKVEAFIREEGEAETKTSVLEADAVGPGADQDGAVRGVVDVEGSRSSQAVAASAKEEKRPDPFGLEQQVHPPESFFCTHSVRVFVVETDNPSLPLVVLEAHGEDPLLKKGESLPAGFAFEWPRRPIGWISVVDVAA
jgi:hypothetical protein